MAMLNKFFGHYTVIHESNLPIIPDMSIRTQLKLEKTSCRGQWNEAKQWVEGNEQEQGIVPHV